MEWFRDLIAATDPIALWAIGLTFYAWFGTWTGFLVIGSAKRILKAGLKLPPGARAAVYVWGVVGLPGDVLYNAIIGTFVFREAPKWLRGEIMYSSRIERHANGPFGWRRDKATPFAMILNAVDEEHIDLPEAAA